MADHGRRPTFGVGSSFSRAMILGLGLGFGLGLGLGLGIGLGLGLGLGLGHVPRAGQPSWGKCALAERGWG